MQMNEIVGLVQIGARRPKSKRAPDATRPMREPRAERQSADAPRRREPAAEKTRLPPQYGAGF